MTLVKVKVSLINTFWLTVLNYPITSNNYTQMYIEHQCSSMQSSRNGTLFNSK